MATAAQGAGDAEFSDAQVDALCVRLMERHREAIATAISDTIVQRVQVEIGRSSLRALAWLAGAIVVAAVAALSSNQGFWKFIFERS